jgi:hypothetical protein
MPVCHLLLLVAKTGINMHNASRSATWAAGVVHFQKNGMSRASAKLESGLIRTKFRLSSGLPPLHVILMSVLFQHHSSSNSAGLMPSSLAILMATFFSVSSKLPSDEAIAIVILSSKRAASGFDFILPSA